MSVRRTRELRPPPRREDLSRRPLHEVVRDYPEVLGPLRVRGLDVAGAGGEPVGALEAEVVRVLVEVTAWRPSPSREEGD